MRFGGDKGNFPKFCWLPTEKSDGCGASEWFWLEWVIYHPILPIVGKHYQILSLDNVCIDRNNICKRFPYMTKVFEKFDKKRLASVQR